MVLLMSGRTTWTWWERVWSSCYIRSRPAPSEAPGSDGVSLTPSETSWKVPMNLWIHFYSNNKHAGGRSDLPLWLQMAEFPHSCLPWKESINQCLESLALNGSSPAQKHMVTCRPPLSLYFDFIWSKCLNTLRVLLLLCGVINCTSLFWNFRWVKILSNVFIKWNGTWGVRLTPLPSYSIKLDVIDLVCLWIAPRLPSDH